MKKISCIIPCYNEEEVIGHVLHTVVSLIGNHLCEVIVIDDGSRDRTWEIVQKFSGLVALQNKVNIGKSRTVAEGIKRAHGEYIFLLDADLKFLTQENVIDLLKPINNGDSDVSMSFRKNSWPLFPFKKIDYCSGERVIARSYLMQNIDAMMMLSSYGLEVFINRIIIKNKLRITVVHWPLVENYSNRETRGFIKTIKVITKVWRDVLSTSSIFEIYYQNIKMLRLLQK